MIEEFAAFLEPVGLEHFRPDEFLVSVDRTSNVFPPQALWPNLVATALVLDAVREHYGRPLVITSCYRSKEYNRQVGGTEGSNHQAFTAADFGVAGVSPPDVATLLKQWRGRWFPAPFRPERAQVTIPGVGRIPFTELKWRQGTVGPEFKLAGGIGEYARFTHFDTRGLNHTWSGH